MNQNDLRRLAAIGGMDLTQPSVSFKDFNMFKNKGFDLLQDYQNTNKFIADNNLMQSPVDEEADKKAKRKEGLKNLRDTLAIIGARRSGNYALAEQMKQQVDLRKQQEEQQKKQAERQAKIAQYKENNPGMVGILEALEAGIPYQLLMMQQNKNNNSNKLRFGNEDKLRDEHQKLSGTFIDVRDAYGRILSNAEEQTAASDLSLIFNYMKMLDPGSVVREGEFANAQNSAGVPDRIRSRYNNVLSGERLAENTRQDFIQTAQDLYSTQLASQSYLDKNYKDLAISYGLDPDKVVLDFGSPIAKKEFKYNLSIMSNEDLASLDESQFTQEQIKEIEKEIKKRLP